MSFLKCCDSRKMTSDRVKKWRKNNPEKLREQRNRHNIKVKERYNKDPQYAEKQRIKSKKWSLNNPDKISSSKRKQRVKIKNKLADNLRKRIKAVIKNNIKSGGIEKLLGCSIDYFKQYLEALFYKDINNENPMTWENYGFSGWHLDHIIPLSYFDLTNEDQIKIACNFKNIRPMWATENLKKSNKLPDNYKQLIEEIKENIK